MGSEFEFYHGVALCRIIHNDHLKSIRSFRKDSNSAYIINEEVGIYIKYCTKRLTPWHFTFMPAHIDELFSFIGKLNKVFLVLVCKNDGIVCLNSEEIKVVLDKTAQKAQGIAAYRKPREEYRISGFGGDIKYKFANNQFPNLLFEGLK